MLEQARERTIEFQNRLTAAGIETAIINDENTIAYLARFWGYLSVKFGRPTFLLLRSGEVPCVITPLMESEMAGNMTWDDMGPNRWENVLSRAIGNIGVELAVLPAVVRNWFDDQMPSTKLTDVGAIMGNMRMIKSSEDDRWDPPDWLNCRRHDAGHRRRTGIRSCAGSHRCGYSKSSRFLTDRGWEAFISPMIHNLQIMQSGHDTSMVHRRASVKKLEKVDPVYFCFAKWGMGFICQSCWGRKKCSLS